MILSMKRLNPSLWPSAILFAGVMVNPIALAQDSDPEPGRLLNLSNRGLVGTGPRKVDWLDHHHRRYTR